MSFCSSEKARYLDGPERAFDLVFRDLNSNHATCLENFIANKITWLLPGLTSQLFPTGKRTVADIAQLPVPNNATPFEIFQLKISDEALYEENGEVGSSPGIDTNFDLSNDNNFEFLSVHRKIIKHCNK